MTGGLFGLTLLIGLTAGLGLWLIVARLPFMRTASFADRIAPSLRAADTRSRLLNQDTNVTPFGPFERIFRPVALDLLRWFDRFNMGSSALTRRLERAGRGVSALDFRVEQIVWSAGGLLIGVVFAALGVLGGRFGVLPATLLALGCGLAGFVIRDSLLSSQIKRREAKMLAEFPSLAELMALAVSAGESAGGALSRVVRSSSGELSQEFAMVLAQTRAGAPLTMALSELSRRTQLAPLGRFVDGLNVALERGTPLADVLRAQAQDVRDMSKRELMEAAGRKEIGMMVPLVFGILPLTVIFAVFPGIALLSVGW